MDVVLLELASGGVGVMTLAGAPQNDAEIEAEIAKTQLDVRGWRVADSASLPAQRDFRDAWTFRGDAVEHDMSKARDIHRDRIRAVRAPMFADLDVASVRATEAGDGAALAEIVTRKEQLRAAPAHPGIEAAQTVEELRAVWPFGEDDVSPSASVHVSADGDGDSLVGSGGVEGSDLEDDPGEQPEIFTEEDVEALGAVAVEGEASEDAADDAGSAENASSPPVEDTANVSEDRQPAYPGVALLPDELGARRNAVLAAITTEKLTRLSIAMDPSRADFLAARFAEYQNAGALGLAIDDALAADSRAFQELRDRRDRITNYAMQLEQSALDGDMDRLSAMHAGLGDGWP